MTLKMLGKTDGTAGRAMAAKTWSWPRASLGCAIVVAAAAVGRRRGSLVSTFEPAWRTQRGRAGAEDDGFDFAFERNTPSTTNEFIELELTDGGSKFPAIEAARDCRVSIWNVRNVCEMNGWFWICVGLVIVILTVLSGVPSGISISDDCSQQKETDKNAAWQRQMKRARTPCRISKIRPTSWNPDGTGVICRSERLADADGTGAICRRETCGRWWNWCGLRAQELQVLLV